MLLPLQAPPRLSEFLPVPTSFVPLPRGPLVGPVHHLPPRLQVLLAQRQHLFEPPERPLASKPDSHYQVLLHQQVRALLNLWRGPCELLRE